MSLMELTTKEVGKHTIKGVEYTLYSDINYGYMHALDEEGNRPVDGVFTDMEQLIQAIKANISRDEELKKKLVKEFKDRMRREEEEKQKRAQLEAIQKEAEELARKEYEQEKKRKAVKKPVAETTPEESD